MSNNILNRINDIKDPAFLFWLKQKIQENSKYSQYDINDLYQEYINRDNDLKSNGESTSMKRVLSNGRTATPVDSMNNYRINNSAFTNWYGIILTLIFSFAIGYLIAWILLKMR